MSVLRGLFAIAMASALSFPAQPPVKHAAPNARGRQRVSLPAVPGTQHNSRGNLSPSELEYYLSDDGIGYIRPGLKITVNSVTIGADRKPVVDFTITDSLDQPLDRNGKVTPGAISISPVLSWYDPLTRNYASYVNRTVTAAPGSPHAGQTAVQATSDSGGTWNDVAVGHSIYTFKNALPAGFDATKTTTLGIYSTRNMTDIVGKNYFANTEYDFRPDGQQVSAKWDELRNANCNQCHDPLAAHGGSRQDVKLCVLCHNPGTTDPETGNTVDFKVMVHKIHFGENLPSVKAGTPYQIWGFNNSINDYSTVALPQDIRNCGGACHEGHVAANKPAQSDTWFTAPARAACGSCHDDINWTTGANHPGGPQTDDSACASCHIADSGTEFDASIKGAHTIPTKSKQLAGLTASIVSVTNTAPGQKPTVVFAIKNGDGSAVDGTKLATFAPILGGSTKSYNTYWRESGVATGTNPGSFDATTGNTSYTFTHAIPADATGSWAVSADIYRNATIKEADGDPNITLREAAFNPVQYVAVTDATPQPRRTVATTAQCNVCHDQLALHGGQRQNVNECVICHNPTEGDQSRRPASAGAKESVSFQRLIHRIHTGEELTQDFTIYGFGGSANNFNEVRFPGDRRNCAKCHAGTSYTLPLPTGIGSVTTLRDYFSPQGPGTAACLGCHDNQDAAAHAYLNTTNFGNATGNSAEACATCHGTGKDWDVAKVHAR